MVDLAGGLNDAYQGVAGAADHLAGSTDEAVARSFDDEEGGGLYDGTAGWLDHMAGSTDEAVARQFDDEQGGGIFDYDTWAGVADHAAGSTDEWFGRQTQGFGRWIPYIAAGVAILGASYLLGQLFTFNIGGGTGA
jgi:hypothetical protein